jgi:hypothetical protein
MVKNGSFRHIIKNICTELKVEFVNKKVRDFRMCMVKKVKSLWKQFNMLTVLFRYKLVIHLFITPNSSILIALSSQLCRLSGL